MPRRLAPSRAAFLAGLLSATWLLAVPALAGETLFEPVLAHDFPDPFILPVGERYVAYATNSDAPRINVQVAVSADLRRWAPAPDPSKPSRPRDALPDLPAWARSGSTWAPEVLKVGDGYVLYFT